MRTDTIFYQLFQTFPSLLFELIAEPPSLANSYEFSYREIKELARSFDGLFLPTESASQQPIYFVEVQFQPKSDFYWRFITEVFVYLGQYKPANDWRAVAIFARRNLDDGVPMQYRGLLMSQQITSVYLDELGETASSSLSLGIVQLVVGSGETAVELTHRLLQQARTQLSDEALLRKVIELIESVLIYKFTALSRQEIETMFGLSDLKETRFYQEAKEDGKQEGKLEGKLETVPILLQLGLTVPQIAERLGLDIEAVKRVSRAEVGDPPKG
ncbi:Rpn family recombination-promoting nuclease/putative transposase [Planktothrix sp. FACHB-1355]|uniref:Rpn family recombination-promoting nuclease/putative transposase n=1 Tax=Aerosakkonema funiforme FACHB-1375 TaxID=2949571 RepID=A0A926ZFD3_9CYAN|nr:Rpn family recombination-promoting nuclease/putative transposase [Aerosakkonema funiforme]MBD2180725.1 Rpn family recombination-promoting nuclease/putative transposase [Aerosakkonema funiforme FACHB-1375]MBD3559167.1 Rpn family recombination-promoting nuclease/putative transposase [Planktothrix sp. FACHB-1355]